MVMTDDLKEFWKEALKIIETGTSFVTYEVWISSLEPVDIFKNTLIMVSPTTMAVNVIKNNYLDLIRHAANKVNGNITDVFIMPASELKDYLKTRVLPGADVAATAGPSPNPQIEPPIFNPKYTFDNFVVGKSNQLAHAAAKAVADSPGKSYNPLFIYGGSGLGKTHIMHAIGNQLLKEKPYLKVNYLTSERFVNELVEAIRVGKEQSTKQFRNKYRSLDVLMVDDIQFMANKVSTQEEFFHTFNDLYQLGKQIIISSDRAPKFLSELEERLRSRFQWGLIVDIQPPELETRLAILKKKAENENYNVDEKVFHLIAERIDSNIREMEGMLSRITFYASLIGASKVTHDIAVEALKDFLDNKREVLTIDKIIDAACSYYSISKADMISKKKNREIVEPRQVCIYIITEMLNVPLAAIGSALGGRDHTTIMYARDKITELIQTNTNIATAVKDIKDMILRQ
jgi:chromosomal replication initiator protein